MPYSPNNTTNGLSRRYTSLHSLAQARIRLLKPEQLTKEAALRTQTSFNKPRTHSAGAPLSHHIPGRDPPEEQPPHEIVVFCPFSTVTPIPPTHAGAFSLPRCGVSGGSRHRCARPPGGPRIVVGLALQGGAT